MNKRPLSMFFVAAFLLVPCAAATTWNFSGGVTSIYQTTTDDRIDPEVVASADLVIQRMFKRGDLRLYLEANSTPREQGVAANLPEANTDAGSALNRSGDGRIQISELAYHHVFSSKHELTFGLVDVSGYFDQSRIASDESTQFLAASFVQNPTIDLPDYTLGAVYEYFTGRDLVLRMGLTSSNGLADNPNLSYAQLLDVDDSDKGVFIITSAAINKLQWQARVGTWTHTAPHPGIDGTREDLKNYGLYANGGFKTRLGAVNARFGLANQAVSRAAGFAAVTYHYKRDPLTFGIGAGRVFQSNQDREPETDDISHFESYLRWDVTEMVILTFDVQQLANSNFVTSNTPVDSDITIFGLRLTLLWD